MFRSDYILEPSWSPAEPAASVLSWIIYIHSAVAWVLDLNIEQRVLLLHVAYSIFTLKDNISKLFHTYFINLLCHHAGTVSKYATGSNCLTFHEFPKQQREMLFLFNKPAPPLWMWINLHMTQAGFCSLCLLCCICASHCEFSWISEHRRVRLWYLTVGINTQNTQNRSFMCQFNISWCLANGNLCRCWARLTVGNRYMCILADERLWVCFQVDLCQLSLKPVD